MISSGHEERHFTASEFLRDMVIGMSDGLTVPFALAAGLTGAVGSSSIIVTAGLAEIAAGSIAMGLGGYLAARGDADHYERERGREAAEVSEVPAEEEWEVREILAEYGLADEEAAPFVNALKRAPEKWVDFMMRFELGLERAKTGRAARSAATIAGAYIASGLLPLAPYVLFRNLHLALGLSSLVTIVALSVFGAVKGRMAGLSAITSAAKTALIGGAAAAAAYAIARLIT
ncbi:MAG TPA: VIT1/CCC1 transporter family protein [Spirochaetia bacterium]|nr:VIT1/CCC1 transporter family protein [Spirochaetia bacterium]